MIVYACAYILGTKYVICGRVLLVVKVGRGRVLKTVKTVVKQSSHTQVNLLRVYITLHTYGMYAYKIYNT